MVLSHLPVRKNKEAAAAVPTSTNVIRAMKTNSEQASEEMIASMTFFLTIVIPCVCPEITAKKDWMAGSSHVEKFAGCWTIEMATGLLVLSEFSDTKNLEHNAGLGHEEDDDGENAPPLGRKKRKRLHTSAHRDNLQSVYYELIKEMEEVEKSPGFTRRMDDWDRKCSSDQNNARKRGPESRINMVPLAHRGSDRKDKAFNSFIQGNPMFSDIFSSLNNISPLSNNGQHENDTTVPITQQSPFLGTPV